MLPSAEIQGQSTKRQKTSQDDVPLLPPISLVNQNLFAIDQTKAEPVSLVMTDIDKVEDQSDENAFKDPRTIALRVPENPQIDASESMSNTRRCNCKGGQCRQLYCVCLKSGMPCTPGVCQCTGCLNDERDEAEQVRENQKRSLAGAVRKGCNCKKNYCRKNYCICHGAGLMCDRSLCHCTECFNYDDAPPVPISAAIEAADVKK